MQDLVNVKTPRPSPFLFEGCYRRYATALKKKLNGMMEVGLYNHQINVKKSKRSKMAALISNRLTSEYAKIEDFILKRYYLIGR